MDNKPIYNYPFFLSEETFWTKYYQDAAFKAQADEFSAQLGYDTVLSCPKDDRGLLIEMYHTHLTKHPTPWWKKS